MAQSKLVLQWPDTHIPDHHEGAVKALLHWVKDVQPDEVIFTGDLIDCLSTARWTAGTVEEDGSLLQREVDETLKILDRFRKVYDGKATWLPGNHEDRLAKWGHTRGRGVWGLDVLTVPKLLEFTHYGIEMPGPIYPFADGWVAIHGERLGARSGMSVDKELTRFGVSVLMGHCHRLAVVRRDVGGRVLWGVEGGHLMDQTQASYLAYGKADWAMGFGLIEFNGRYTNPQTIPMLPDGSFLWNEVAWR